MELKLVSEKDNPVFSRKEIVFRAASSPTPSIDKIAAAIAESQKCAKDAVVVDMIEQRFGQKNVTVHAKVYASAQKAKQYERKYKFARMERSGKKKEEKKA